MRIIKFFNPGILIKNLSNSFSKKSSLPPKKILKTVFLIIIIILLFYKIHNPYSDLYQKFSTHRNFYGDEVKYLRMTQSLATDGNIELSNLRQFSDIWQDEEKKEEKGLPADNILQFGHYFTGKNGGVYSLHMPGVSLLLLPSYLLDSILYPTDPKFDPPEFPLMPRKLCLTRLLLFIMAVLIIFLLSRLLYHLFNSLFLGMLLLLLFVLNSPFAGYIFQIYPDLWAVFFSLLVLNAIFFPFKNKWLNYILIIIGIGALPWLHQRLIPLSLGLFLCYIFYRRKENNFFKKASILCFILAIISLLYFYYFYSITGNPSPLSPAKLHGRVYASWENLPLGFFGNFFHPMFSIIWAYPWIILFFFGIYWGFKKDFRLTIALLLIFIPNYLIASAAVPWHGATWPKNRHLLAILPLFLIFSGFTIQDFFQKFSYSKLIFYLSYFVLIILNTKIWFIKFEFSLNSFTYSDLIWIIKSIIIISFLYLSIFLSEKFLFQKDNLIPGK